MTDDKVIYAHSLPGEPEERWERLEKHLDDVADLAERFASVFDSGAWGRLAGFWHDLGKYSDAFQEYLRESSDPDSGEENAKPGRVDHSTFGAQHAAKTFAGPVGAMLAFCIAGHHAGLSDATAAEEAARGSSLASRLIKNVPAVNLPADVPAASEPRLPFKPHPTEVGLQVALFTRMLFSCLIDADRTATEAFCNPSRAAERNRVKPALAQLSEALDVFLQKK